MKPTPFLLKKSRIPLLTALFSLILLAGFWFSLFTGVTSLDRAGLLSQWIAGETSKELLVFQSLRMPRAVLGAIIGANLAVAGSLMQAITRNPLASPQVFGVNAGASFVVVACLVFFPAVGNGSLVYFAFAGAILGGSVVYSFASSRGMTNVKLALVGMAIHLLLSSMTKGLIIFNEEISSVLYWLSGSLSGASWKDVTVISLWSAIGLLLAVGLAGSLSIFRLGEEVAIGLGQRIRLVRIIASIAVVLLAGSSVAVAGAIGFVGLMIPHIVRAMVGEDYRLVIPFSALAGAILVTYADVLSRFIAFPYESPVGIVTALLGTPFFLYLARSNVKKGEAQ